ncbi:MAG TPA: magnesium-translocating P-type ATPase [Fimbriimonas sp.]|nr:magnesium-translocating P-type ATPase [Fimbriimonas sp.]
MTGLTSAEAAERLARFGPNEPTAKQRGSLYLVFAPLFANPLVIVLLVSAIVSGAIGDLVNATIISVLVLSSIALDAIQTLRSKKAVADLVRQVSPTALALRDGQWVSIHRSEVVPGDLIKLAAGDLIPADGTLLEEEDLHVQEAALTGESMPAEKEVGTGDDQEKVFLGTSVVSGSATMQVEKTGTQTEFGGIAARLSAKAPETEFERGLRRFGGLITRIVLLLIGFTLAVMLGLRRPPFESLLFAVALAVGLTPEFLPMITTLTLARGAMRMARKKVIVKNLASIQNFGSMDILCSDKTGTLTKGEMTLDRAVDLEGKPSDEVLRWAHLNASMETGISSPLDQAICARQLPDDGWKKVDEIPFDFERRRVSVVVEKEARRVLVIKGAPESVLAICEPCGLLKLAEELEADGFRVIAIATKDVAVQRAYGVEDEAGMRALGLLAFIDPPLEDAKETIEALAQSGVAIKILTGDSAAVTCHVCRTVGIDPGEVVTGDQLDKLGDDALPALAERTLVFARVSPAQKNRIILALKARSHVVGYMGDGINDAPSLHTSDVGISFASATDIAKDAAQFILVERDLELLHQAVIEGRMAFGNVMKYLLMGTSSNFGNVFSMAGSSLCLPFLPMLPRQILLNNLLYDLAQITIPTDRVDDSYARKPKHWDLGLIKHFMIYVGPVSSIFDVITFVAMLKLFHAGPTEFRTGWFVESLATQTLVIFVIRTRMLPWQSRPSAALTWSVIAVVVLGAVLPFTPIARPLGFVALPLSYFAFLAVVTLLYLGAVEALKRKIFGRFDAVV